MLNPIRSPDAVYITVENDSAPPQPGPPGRDCLEDTVRWLSATDSRLDNISAVEYSLLPIVVGIGTGLVSKNWFVGYGVMTLSLVAEACLVGAVQLMCLTGIYSGKFIQQAIEIAQGNSKNNTLPEKLDGKQL